jgi:hypothetical protein
MCINQSAYSDNLFRATWLARIKIVERQGLQVQVFIQHTKYGGSYA